VTRNRDVATQGGLVLLNTTTFSAQSSVSFNNVFSSTYENYLVKLNLTASAQDELRLRLRASGTDFTTNSAATRIERRNGAFETDDTARTYAWIGQARGTTTNVEVSVLAPNTTKNKSVLSNCAYSQAGANHGNLMTMYTAESATQFDGFTVYPASGNITGTIKVYGYK
jgi:hypothetical protein